MISDTDHETNYIHIIHYYFTNIILYIKRVVCVNKYRKKLVSQMYNDEIVKAVVKDQIKSILDQMNDDNLKYELLMDLYEEVISELLDSNRIN